MPTYEYECSACGDRFTRQHRMTDPSVTECPVCSGRVRKVFHAPGIAVRGGGSISGEVPACSVGGG